MPRIAPVHALRKRARIAQAAARLIAEHGLTDWTAAKRKACRELGLSDHEGLPGNDEVEQELRTYNSLYQAAAQGASLRAQRADALAWMKRLIRWRPVLTGAVAAGFATVHSEITLELEAEDLKAVEMTLANEGIDYSVVPPSNDLLRAPQLRVEGVVAGLRLVVVSPLQRRHRSRRDGDYRLTVEELDALIAADDPAAASVSP